jgi:hypothetical protein
LTQHLTEHSRQCRLVALDEPRDRGVIGPLLRRDNAGCDVLDARALNHARGADAARVGIEQQRNQVDSTGCRNAGR